MTVSLGIVPAPGGAGFSRNCLRVVLAAASRPGEVVTIESCVRPIGSVGAAAFAVCAGLFGTDSRFWLSTDLRRNQQLLAGLRFQFGALCCSDSRNAEFAMMNGGEWDGPQRFRHGIPGSPYLSATIIIEVEALFAGGGTAIRFAGAEDRMVGVCGIVDRFWQDVERNYYLAPLGLDFLLTCGDRLVAVTRQCRASVVRSY